MKIKLNSKTYIGGNNRPLIVAEISGNHNGKKSLFLKHIIMAAKNGADLIKIQTYEPKDITINSKEKKFIIKKGIWKGKSLWDIYSKAHTPFSWHQDAFKLAKKLNIMLFSSPFSKRAVDLLESYNVPLYKIASFEITDYDLIDYIAKKNKPIVLSTGMASIKEIKNAIKIIKKYHNKIILLYCVSGYPTKENDSNLSTIVSFKGIFRGLNIGLSDHTNDILTSMTSAAFNVCMIEKHFIISNKIDSLDKKFSIDSLKLKNLKKNIIKIHSSIGTPDKVLKKVEKMNLKLRRSIFSIKNIKKGEKLSKKNIRSFRPLIGINSNKYFKILGRKAKKDIIKYKPIFENEIN